MPWLPKEQTEVSGKEQEKSVAEQEKKGSLKKAEKCPFFSSFLSFLSAFF